MRAQNRHDTAKWKKKGHDSRNRCGNPKCFVCHPYPQWGNKRADKAKYRVKYKTVIE